METFTFNGVSYTAAEMITEAARQANSAPTDVAASGNSVAENSGAGTVISTLSATDADSGDSHSYRFTDASGADASYAGLAIVGDEIQVSDPAAFDFESAETITVYVRANDGFEDSPAEQIDISVSDVAEALTVSGTFADSGVAETSITGSSGGDDITAHDDGGVIDGGDGNDTLAGGSGDDIITGGVGDDRIDGGAGHNNQLFGGAGDDRIYGRGYNDLVYGGDGADQIYMFYTPSVSNTSAAYGEEGNDALYGSNGNQRLYGGAGDDYLTGGDDYGTADVDILDGGDGNDTIVSGMIATPSSGWEVNGDIMIGGAGNDNITGGTANDTITGGADDDMISGGAGADMAVWSGNLADFAVSYDAGTDTFTIADQNASDGLDEGTDTVTGVETFTFNGVSYTAAEMITEAARQANSAPIDVAATGNSVAENSGAGTVISTLSATDADSGDSHSYRFTDASGADASYAGLAIVGNEIQVSDPAAFDFESAETITVYVRANDGFEDSPVEQIDISVSDVAEVIQLDDTGVTFSDIGGAAETSITGGDGADTITAHTTGGDLAGGRGADQLIGQTGNDTLSGDNGYDELTGGAGDDFVDGGLGADTATWSGDLADFMVSYNAATETFTIVDGNTGDGHDEGTDTVTGIETFTFNGVSYTAAEMQTEAARQANSAPDGIDHNYYGMSEASSAGHVVLEMYAEDDDVGDSHSYRFVDADGDDTSYDGLEIVGNEVRVSDPSAFDHETADSITVRIVANDGFEDGEIEQFTINIDDVNEAPTAIELEESAFNEDSAGIYISEVFVTDADEGDGAETMTFAVDDTRFEIVDGLGGVPFLKLKDGVSVDHETEETVTLTITATDEDGLSHTETITLQVEDNNDAPTALWFEADHMNENNAGTEEILMFGTDPDGDALSYSVDDARFEIRDDDGEYTLALKSGTPLDYETESSVSITVTATDGDGESYSETITLDVLDQAENLALSGDGVTFTDTAVAETSITGTSGDDDITGHDDGSRLYGEGGDDTLTGGDGDDVIFFGEGDDIVYGGAGDDVINDVTSGTLDGFDELHGGDGNDIIWAGNDADQLYGDAGNDSLNGQNDDDVIEGGAGDDTINGGSGSDTAVWAGELSDFTVSYDSGSGAFTISDTNSADGLGEGADTVTNVEVFTFNGVSYTAAEMITEAARQANSAPIDVAATGNSVAENSGREP